MGSGSPEQAIWKTEGASKRAAVQSMFGEIAPSYDKLNGLISLRLHHRWRQRAVQMLRLNPGDYALDVCCGTGDFMVPLASAVGSTGRVFGVDFSLPMLQAVEAKIDQPSVSLGDACQLPISSGRFNAVSVGWGIRNVPDIDQAHRELFRVLKPGGRFVSLDMARPKNPLTRLISEFVFNVVVPRFGAMYGKTDAYTYLPKSTRKFSSRDQLQASMESAGFVNVGHQDLMFGNLCIHFAEKATVTAPTVASESEVRP